MNRIKILESCEFGAIRTLNNETGEILFCAKDIALALGYRDVNRAIHRHVNAKDLFILGSRDTLGRRNYIIYINEAGFRSFMKASKSESAKRFKKWASTIILLN